jgi:DNA (cytosine-5)-methyltransferase 1
MLRHVDLCSGIGGFALGFEWAGLSEPVMFCDTEKWCRQILKKHWPDVPITEDVKELASDPERNVPDCDILTAGYPCQPFSLAGKQRGEKDDRHIWPYIRKIVAHKRPTWCVFENVYGHIALGLDKVLADLESEGYSSRSFVVPACGVDANHKRDRVWIIARNVANACGVQLQRSAEEQVHGEFDLSRKFRRGCQDIEGRWATESSMGRVADGVSRRVDRIKGLGNAIVPQIAQRIGNTIKEYERSTST